MGANFCRYTFEKHVSVTAPEPVPLAEAFQLDAFVNNCTSMRKDHPEPLL